MVEAKPQLDNEDSKTQELYCMYCGEKIGTKGTTKGFSVICQECKRIL